LSIELNKNVDRISGGQRQRVALGRAMIRKANLFLMDEPLSNLDAKLRVQMRAELRRLQKTLGTTTVYVTHDQAEAMTLADRVAVVDNGVIQQLASPEEIYFHPVNKFVAGFIGSPQMNFFQGMYSSGTVKTDYFEYPLSPATRKKLKTDPEGKGVRADGRRNLRLLYLGRRGAVHFQDIAGL